MKSNFRKVALLLAALALLCSALFVSTATVAAAGDPTVVVTDAEGKAGDEITVQVKLENNPGLTSARTAIGYDASALELVDVVAEGSYAESRPTINTKKNPLVINFCDMVADADYTEELFATITFRIKDDATPGVYPFELICSYEDDWFNLNWDTVEFAEQVGAVTVIGDEPVCAHEYDCDCDPDCNLCGEIREVSHHIEYIAAVAPTCFENGNIEYWFCDVCGQVWLDEACTLNTNLKAVILPMAHCELTHVEAKAPTCFEDGNIEYWYCEACGYAWLDAEGTLSTNLKAVILPMAHGELTHVEAKAADCVNNGNIEYWYCEACGYAWLDAEGTLSTNLKAVILPAIGHTYDDEYDADCNVCGAIRDVDCKHEYTYACDKVCALCGELTNPGALHNIIHVEGVDATCYENGNIEYWYCDICGYAWADEALTQVTNQMSVVIPMGHGTIEHVEAVAPTCYENGNIEYWYCEACGQAWLDAECTLNTNLKAVILPMAHGEAIHVEAVAPTCYENGNIEYWYCEACGQAWLDAECTLNTNLKAVILPTIDHVYSSEYDVDCNLCGEIREVVVAPGTINHCGTSVSEEVSGLAYQTNVGATDAELKNGNYYVEGSASVQYNEESYKLVKMGTVLNNKGLSNLTLDDVDGIYVINIEAKRLCDVTETGLYYAVRVINIPEEHLDTEIIGRPYMILEKDGVQTVVYGEDFVQSYKAVAGN